MPPQPSRWRQPKTWLLLAGISIGWKVVVLTLGAAIPRWVVGDGVQHLPSEQRVHGRLAMASAAELWNAPLERWGMMVRALRVVSVNSTARPKTRECPQPVVRVRAYTYFAIPYSEAVLTCGKGTIEYRFLRDRT